MNNDKTTSAKTPLFDALLSKLDFAQRGNCSLLDFGCGIGDFIGIASRQAPAGTMLVGVDADDRIIDEAISRYPGISFVCSKNGQRLELPDALFDIVISIDVLECVNDKAALIDEFHRILKPGGTVLTAHWDWDTMIYDTGRRDLAKKAVAAFSDWKQPWMHACDGQMGRKLWGLFEGSGKFRGKPDSFNLIETEFRPGTYGFDRLKDMAALTGEGGLEQADLDRFREDLMENSRNRQYFFSLTSFIYHGRKIVYCDNNAR